MPFVKRDDSGAVVAVYLQAADPGLEEVTVDDSGLKTFLDKSLLEYAAGRQWMESDLSVVRVLEDVVDMLIERGVFVFMDLPEGAQQKLLERRGLRKEFAYMDTLFGDQETFDEGDEGEGEGFL